ncbi:MAG: ABC transporter permease [Acidobacteriaceae bacterium]|nr:ABC transporter permease [Acidobacteriaceae bacterium]
MPEAISPADVEHNTEVRSGLHANPGPRRVKIIRPPSFSPAVLVSGLSELFWYRDLLYTLTIHRIKVRYKQSALGVAWAFIQPLSLMLVYTVVFSLFTRIPSGGIAYPLFVLSGILPWTFFQTALASAAQGLVSHQQMITKVYFPREIIPLTYVIAALFDLLIASMILSAMMAWYHVPLTREAFYLVPILVIEFFFTCALALLFSAVQVRFRDIGIAMPLLLQLWMFASPVVYGFAQVPVRFRALYVLNPMAGIVEDFRRVLIQGIGIDNWMLSVSALATAIILPAAYLFFKQREATVADII